MKSKIEALFLSLQLNRSWLATIRYCMKATPGPDGGLGAGDYTNKQDYHGDPPEVPPRHLPGGRAGDRLSSSSNFEISPQSDVNGGTFFVLYNLKNSLRLLFLFDQVSKQILGRLYGRNSGSMGL